MDDKTSSYLALNIRRLRSARQLSQQKLATLAGIPRPTLAHLESGSANPTLSVLMRLASALQVMIEELIIPQKPRPSTSARKTFQLASGAWSPFENYFRTLFGALTSNGY